MKYPVCQLLSDLLIIRVYCLDVRFDVHLGRKRVAHMYVYTQYTIAIACIVV